MEGGVASLKYRGLTCVLLELYGWYVDTFGVTQAGV